MPSSAPAGEATSVIAQEFRVDEPCAINVDVPGAHTYMRPASESDRMEVDISVSGCPPEEAEDVIHRMDLGTHQRKDTVRVDCEGSSGDAVWWRWIRRLDATIHVILRLPSPVKAEIRVPGGEIDVADLEGYLDLNVMGGPCRTENLSGTLQIRAESSDVSVSGFSGDEVVARVAVGTLTLEDIESDTISVRAVAAPMTLSGVSGSTSVTANGGPVELEDLSGPCTARSQGGTLTFHGAPDETMELTTVGSALNVVIPGNHAADLSMTGTSLSLDEAFSFDGDQSNHEITGPLNGGGPELTLRGIQGPVECRSG